MKNKQLTLEHADMMNFSREIMELKLPLEMNVVFYSVIILFLVILTALPIVKINDVIKTNGIIKTEMNNSTIKNVISGKIKEKFYQPDQFVWQGDVLYRIDDEIYLSLKKDLELQLKKNKKQLECFEKLLESFYSEKNIIPMEDLFIYSQLEDYLKQLNYMNRQVKILQKRYEFEKDQPEIFKNQQLIQEAYLSLQLSIGELEKFRASFLSKIAQMKNDLAIEGERLEQELLRTNEQYSYLEIKAPVSGFIQEVSSLNIGDYVFADQVILNIVPNDKQNFRVELHIPSKDIGEILPDMEVKLRLSAFPFFEYKGAYGKIKSIDSDVRQSSNGTLYYIVYSDIDKNTFTNKKGIEYPLRAGIEVDARIVLEKISVLNYVLRKMDFIK